VGGSIRSAADFKASVVPDSSESGWPFLALGPLRQREPRRRTMSVEKVKRASGEVVWRVRWRQHGRNRARTFSTRRDAADFDGEVRRQRRAGSLIALDAGAETLGEYVIGTWAATHAATLAPKTRLHYASLYDHHLRPYLATIALRDISPETIARWQADRLAAGAGPVAVRHALDLLGSVLEYAFVAGRIAENPVRRVKKATRPRRDEVQPLSPTTVEAMRVALSPRDAALISVLAYAGLRPGEALGLRWGDIRERTILIQRSVSLGEEADTKTRQHRTVRLLAPLAADLRSWRMAAGHPGDDELVFPGKHRLPWTQAAYQSWRRRAFKRAAHAAGPCHARPYDLRHSFASLLLHEGRSVIYVARQLGHDARLTLTRYGHVIDELEDTPCIAAETAIENARKGACTSKPSAVRESRL
jgi:integrase